MLKIETSGSSAYLIMFDNNPTANVYYGQGEICKTQEDAIEAAEFLKSYFEAKAKGHHVSLVIDDVTPSAEFAQEMMKDGYRQAMNDMRTIAQCESTQIARQIRMERYAVDIFCQHMEGGRHPEESWCVDRAEHLMNLVAEKCK